MTDEYDWEAAWNKPDISPHQHSFTADALPNMCEWACRYGTRGIPVFPCIEAGEKAKSPYTRYGFKDATTDLDQIIDWWTRWPNAMIGRPVPLDQICLDIDPRNGGAELFPVSRTPSLRR
jgi:Bifunctional DNA primase/polymerase, N-terminal